MCYRAYLSVPQTLGVGEAFGQREAQININVLSVGDGEQMNITDPKFKYVPAAATDIRKLFARVRKELAAQHKPKPDTTVRPLKRVSGK